MMTSAVNMTTVALLAFVGAVAFIDLRTKRIPNVLVLAGLLTALALGIGAHGWTGASNVAAGFAAGLAIFLPLYVGGGLGAGDVKAVATVGAFLGWPGAALAAALILVAGMVFGLAILLVGSGLTGVHHLVDRFMLRFAVALARGRQDAIGPVQDRIAAKRFPYGVAIAAGTVGALVWLDRIAPFTAWRL
jgi:prepilin peptidase CpaA